MTVTADAEYLQVDPAALRDTFLIPLAERRIVTGCAGRDVDVLRLDVHVLEEILLHEIGVTLRVIAGEADVLIQIERHHAREVELTPLVHSHHNNVYTERL